MQHRQRIARAAQGAPRQLLLVAVTVMIAAPFAGCFGPPPGAALRAVGTVLDFSWENEHPGGGAHANPLTYHGVVRIQVENLGDALILSDAQRMEVENMSTFRATLRMRVDAHSTDVFTLTFANVPVGVRPIAVVLNFTFPEEGFLRAVLPAPTPAPLELELTHAQASFADFLTDGRPAYLPMQPLWVRVNATNHMGQPLNASQLEFEVDGSDGENSPETDVRGPPVVHPHETAEFLFSFSVPSEWRPQLLRVYAWDGPWAVAPLPLASNNSSAVAFEVEVTVARWAFANPADPDMRYLVLELRGNNTGFVALNGLHAVLHFDDGSSMQWNFYSRWAAGEANLSAISAVLQSESPRPVEVELTFQDRLLTVLLDLPAIEPPPPLFAFSNVSVFPSDFDVIGDPPDANHTLYNVEFDLTSNDEGDIPGSVLYFELVNATGSKWGQTAIQFPSTFSPGETRLFRASFELPPGWEPLYIHAIGFNGSWATASLPAPGPAPVPLDGNLTVSSAWKSFEGVDGERTYGGLHYLWVNASVYNGDANRTFTVSAYEFAVDGPQANRVWGQGGPSAVPVAPGQWVNVTVVFIVPKSAVYTALEVRHAQYSPRPSAALPAVADPPLEVGISNVTAEWRLENLTGSPAPASHRFLWVNFTLSNFINTSFSVAYYNFRIIDSRGAGGPLGEYDGPAAVDGATSENVTLVFELEDGWDPASLHFGSVDGPWVHVLVAAPP